MWKKYRKFSSVDAARNWGKQYYAYWPPRYQLDGKLRRNYDTENPERFLEGPFSQVEIDELKKEACENKWFSFYCGGNWGLAINEKLRFGYSAYSFPQEELIEMQSVLDARLNKSYVPENILGYRFLDYKKLCGSIHKHSINVGTVIEDNGYMGVGLVKPALMEEFGGYDTLLKIMIPKGANGLYIDLISNRYKEQEILFARNSKLRVLFVYRKSGKRIILCKMLNPKEVNVS